MLISRSLLTAAAALLICTGGAFAQSSGRTSSGAVAAPPPYPGKAQEAQVPPAQNPYQPGATGRTVVPGSNSTVAGAGRATYENKAGQVEAGQSGGGGGGGSAGGR